MNFSFKSGSSVGEAINLQILVYRLFNLLRILFLEGRVVSPSHMVKQAFRSLIETDVFNKHRVNFIVADHCNNDSWW